MKKVMNARLFDDHRMSQMPRGTRKLVPGNEPAEAVVSAIEAAHPQIQDVFFRGIGHAVQFAESTILVEVLLELKARGIVALPIHDAVMVPRSRAEDTRTVMLEAFERLAVSRARWIWSPEPCSLRGWHCLCVAFERPCEGVEGGFGSTFRSLLSALSTASPKTLPGLSTGDLGGGRRTGPQPPSLGESQAFKDLSGDP